LTERESQMYKEVLGLRHLKKENVELMDRVNEIDSDQNEEYRAEVFRLRNDNAIWRAKHQVIQNDYKKCAEQRDEFKHQLNAANKEIEALKSKVRDNEQEHPMYPLHWGILQKAKDLTEGVKVDLTKPLEEQCDDFFDKTYEPQWQCPCNKCKEKRANKSERSWEEAASDLALRVAKLEEQLKYTQKINFKD
jgi:Centrosome localisation domain of PPC89